MTYEELEIKFSELEKRQKLLEEQLAEQEKKHRSFFDKVRKMRGHQKEYFKWRASSDRTHAMRMEREVDDLIDQGVKIQKSKQPELFNAKDTKHKA